jgi:drug/metabolite transporter (DMT)-like permease
LATAVCWSVTALAFDAAGRRIGSLAVNWIRLVIAIGLLSAWGAISRGYALPTDADAHAWTWLSLSGLVGFVLGDLCLFRAFVVLGPRLSSLVMSLAPVLTVVMGWLVLGETLSLIDWLGMSMTIAGIAWALSDRAPNAANEPKHPVAGLLLAFGGAAGQAGGLVLSKYGMGDYDPFAATQIRVIAGVAGFSLLFFVLRWWPHVGRGLRDRRAMAFTSLGAFFGPFLGVSLSLLAVQLTLAGVAASIMAITPILLIPLVVIFYRERVGIGGVLGTLLAVGGVMLLFMGG